MHAAIFFFPFVISLTTQFLKEKPYKLYDIFRQIFIGRQN